LLSVVLNRLHDWLADFCLRPKFTCAVEKQVKKYKPPEKYDYTGNDQAH